MVRTRKSVKLSKSRARSYRRRLRSSPCRRKGPAVCRGTAGCKYAIGRKRSYCRRSKSTRRSKRGGGLKKGRCGGTDDKPRKNKSGGGVQGFGMFRRA